MQGIPERWSPVEGDVRVREPLLPHHVSDDFLEAAHRLALQRPPQPQLGAVCPKTLAKFLPRGSRQVQVFCASDHDACDDFMSFDGYAVKATPFTFLRGAEDDRGGHEQARGHRERRRLRARHVRSRQLERMVLSHAKRNPAVRARIEPARNVLDGRWDRDARALSPRSLCTGHVISRLQRHRLRAVWPCWGRAEPMSADTVRRVPTLRARPFLRDATEAEAIRLTARQREELASLGVRERVRARATIYAEGHDAASVFVVVDGVVKAYRDLRSGRSNVYAFLYPHDLFGLAEDGRYVNSTAAVTDTTVFRLPVRELAVLLRHDGDLQYGFLAKVTHELRAALRRSLLLNRRDAAGRLAMFLAMIGEHHAAAAHSAAIPLPMTRTDIAGFLGVSLETVSRAARALERRGLVRFEGRHRFRVVDAVRLERFVRAV